MATSELQVYDFIASQRLISTLFKGTVLLFTCLQLALLVLWALPSAFPTQASIAAATISFIDCLAIGILSYIEHTRSVRPSTILNVYLLFSTLFDIVKAGTLWLRSGSHYIAAAFTSSLSLKTILLILESMEKDLC
jgi:ATP-binding cassette, subfamily C (CFTR/MRP), member 1